jgi:hypothetical protein
VARLHILTGVDEYVNKIQKEQQENNAIERLARNQKYNQ